MGRVMQGVDSDLEAKANLLLYESLIGVTKQSEKSDILTPWKTRDRESHEVLVASPDPSVRQGTYTRVLNRVRPELNGREGLAGLLPRAPRPLSAYMAERSNVQAPGEGVTCNGFHDHYPSHCARHCAASRRRHG